MKLTDPQKRLLSQIRRRNTNIKYFPRYNSFSWMKGNGVIHVVTAKVLIKLELLAVVPDHPSVMNNEYTLTELGKSISI